MRYVDSPRHCWTPIAMMLLPLALNPLPNQAAEDSSVALEVERHRGAVAGNMPDPPDDNLM